MIIAKDDISTLAAVLKRAGERLVLTNGCFDILHRGHVEYLKKARSLGDVLIVGVNTDQSVRSYKGEGRPINTEDDRATVVAALAAVDYVVLFEERTAENLVRLVRPDIYVKGADYKVKDIPEAQIVLGYGGRVELIDFVQGRSTTNIISKIKG